MNMFKCNCSEKKITNENYNESIKSNFEKNLENKISELYDFEFHNNLSGKPIIGISCVEKIKIIPQSLVILVDFYRNTIVYEYSNIEDCKSDYNKLINQVTLFNKHQKNYNDLFKKDQSMFDDDVDDGGFF